MESENQQATFNNNKPPTLFFVCWFFCLHHFQKKTKKPINPSFRSTSSKLRCRNSVAVGRNQIMLPSEQIWNKHDNLGTFLTTHRSALRPWRQKPGRAAEQLPQSPTFWCSCSRWSLRPFLRCVCVPMIEEKKKKRKKSKVKTDDREVTTSRWSEILTETESSLLSRPGLPDQPKSLFPWMHLPSSRKKTRERSRRMRGRVPRLIRVTSYIYLHIHTLSFLRVNLGILIPWNCSGPELQSRRTTNTRKTITPLRKSHLKDHTMALR